MRNQRFGRLFWKLGVAGLLGLPGVMNGQFTFNDSGDLLLGFRKTGAFQGNYELVVDAGQVTQFLALSPGSSLTISNFSPAQLTDAFPDGYQDLQWSAFSAFAQDADWTNSVGVFPDATTWYTRPRTNAAVQSVPPPRLKTGSSQTLRNQMVSVGYGASSISVALGATNSDNNTFLVREPISYTFDYLTAYIGDRSNPNLGDFGGTAFTYTVENTTPDPFSSMARSDLYQSCPVNTVDPLTGLTTGSSYFVGYFTLNTDGTMTFTRATASAVPAAGFSGSPTNGFVGLQVAFTDASTGSITSWVWNFGDGQSVTNNTSVSVNHIYTSAGSYTVSLKVSGGGGSNTATKTSYVVVSPVPTINLARSGANVVISGANCPVGVQYRILNSSKLAGPVSGWTTVATSTFLPDGTFSYTNSTAGSAGFFKLVSP